MSYWEKPRYAPTSYSYEEENKPGTFRAKDEYDKWIGDIRGATGEEFKNPYDGGTEQGEQASIQNRADAFSKQAKELAERYPEKRDIINPDRDPRAEDWKRFTDIFQSSDETESYNHSPIGKAISIDRDYQDYIDTVKKVTGEELGDPLNSAYDPQSGGAYDPQRYAQAQAEFQRRRYELAEKYPEVADIIAPDRPIGEAGTGAGKIRANAERKDSELWDKSAQDTAAWIARLGGGFYSMTHDPIQLGTLLVGPYGHAARGIKGLVYMATKQAAANAGVEAAMQPAIQLWRKEAGMDYGLGHAARDIGMAGAFGFAIDAGVRGVVRGARRAAGNPYMGPDAPSRARLPGSQAAPEPRQPGSQAAPEPASPRAATPDNPISALDQAAKNAPEGSIIKRAAEGDEAALRELASATGADKDPAIKRLLDEMETEKLFPTPEHVDDGEHLSALARAVREQSGAADLPVGDAVKPVTLRDVSRLADEAVGEALRIEGKPVAFRSLDPRQVAADPNTFQFKSGGDASGVTDRLRSVSRWDPVSAGKSIVFERADGTMVIADGHQRLGLAKRTAASGQDAKLDAYIFREKDGWTPEDVRAYAALKNMRELSGKSIDMANVMRERPDLIDGSLPLTDAKLREATMLSRLSPMAFDAVQAGRLPEPYAALIGESVADASRHIGLLNELAEANLPNIQQARLYLKQLMELPTTVEIQHTLFGEESFTRTVLVERTKVLDSALKDLRADKRVFSLLQKEAKTIEGAGNVLARDVNAAQAQSAAELAELIETLATSRGTVATILNDAAASVARGYNPTLASRAFVSRIADILEKEGIQGLLKAEEVVPLDLSPRLMDNPAGPEAVQQTLEMEEILAADALTDQARQIARALSAEPEPRPDAASLANLIAERMPQLLQEALPAIAALPEFNAIARDLGKLVERVARRPEKAAEIAAKEIPKLLEKYGLGQDVERAIGDLFSGGDAALAKLVSDISAQTEDAMFALRGKDTALFDLDPNSTAGSRETKVGDTAITYGVGRNGLVELILIKTPKAKRGQGSGRQAMEAFLRETDAQGLRVGLNADPMDKGIAKPKLEAFYKSLGFKPNKGRTRDFSTQMEFLREPQAPEDAMFALRGYHGSPHGFDRFSMDKIGTGEGAQSYGHGLYFAENPSVARSYQNQLATYSANGKPLGEDMSMALGAHDGDVASLLSERQGQLDKWMSSGNTGKQADSIVKSLQQDVKKLTALQKQKIEKTGALYEVEIDVEHHQLLDWDKPLSEQSEEVKSRLMGVLNRIASDPNSPGPRRGGVHVVEKYIEQDRPIGELVHSLQGALGKNEASQALREAGIPGIRYLDQGSRAPFLNGKRVDDPELLAYAEAKFDGSLEGIEHDIRSRLNTLRESPEPTEADAKKLFTTPMQMRIRADSAIIEMEAQLAKIDQVKSDAFSAPEGTHNIVLFDDKLVKITKKNGEPVTVAERKEAIADMHAAQDAAAAEEESKFALRGFYSPAIRAAEDIRQEKGTGEQFWKQITKTPNVRKDELDRMGLEEFLKDKPSVTKAEVLDFMRAHQVQLDEVELGGKAATKLVSDEEFKSDTQNGRIVTFDADGEELRYFISKTERDGHVLYQPYRWDHNAVLNGPFPSYDQALHVAQGDAATFAKRTTAPKFEEYKVPGGENYRELLIRMPGLEGRKLTAEEHARIAEINKEAEELKWNPAKTQGMTTDEAFAALDKLRTEQRQIEGQVTKGYTSKHFRDQEIVHLRVDDRIGPNGEKILFGNEVQADGHQYGQKVGYSEAEKKQKLKELDEKIAAASSKLEQHREAWRTNAFTNEDPAREVARVALLKADERLNKLKSRKAFVEKSPPAVDMPFKGDLWLELALKRMLLYAVENNYDAISWARSDQIAKAVGAEPEKLALQYDSKIGKFLDKYTKKWGGKVEEAEGVVTPEHLQASVPIGDGYMSKHFYKPMLELLPRPFNSDHYARLAFNEDALGEIPRSFDVIGAIKEVGEPANAAKARELLDAYRAHLTPRPEANPILRITPEMRASVMEGQPLALPNAGSTATSRHATLHNSTLSARASSQMMEIRADIDKAVSRSLPVGWRAEVRQQLVFGDLSEGMRKRNPSVPPSLEIEGTFDPYERIIYVSMAALDPVERTFEEAGHALKYMRLVPEADYNILRAKALEIGARERFKIDERYGQIYGARWKDNPIRLEAAMEEEAIMQMVAARARGDDFGKPTNAIIDKLVKFLRAVRDMLGFRNFRGFEDVFEDMTEGGFARQMDSQLSTNSGKYATLSERKGVSNEQASENGATSGRESRQADAGQPATGGAVGLREGVPAAGSGGASFGLRDRAFQRILRQESASLDAEGNVYAGRRSRAGEARADGAANDDPQRIGSVEPFRAGKHEGRVTAEELDPDFDQDNLARLKYEIFSQPNETKAKTSKDAKSLLAQVSANEKALAKATDPNVRDVISNQLEQLKKQLGANSDKPIEAAHMDLVQRSDGAWEVDYVEVAPHARGQDVGKALYNAVEKDLGIRMSPSGILSDAGLYFWQKRSPASVQWHEPVGAFHYSPKRISDELGHIGREIEHLTKGEGTAANLSPDERAAALTRWKAERGKFTKLWAKLPAEAKAAKGSMFSTSGARKYPLASRDEWHGDANYEQTGGRMVDMTPDEYLAKTRPMKVDDLTRENIDDLKRHIEEGGVLDPLTLYKDGREDGRHRAHAARELGITRVPVLDFRDDGSSFALKPLIPPSASDDAFIQKAALVGEAMFALGNNNARTPGSKAAKQIRDLINAAAARGEMARDEADALIKRYDMLERQHKDAGVAREELAKEIDAKAQHLKRLKGLSEIARKRVENDLMRFRDARGQADPAKAMVAKLENLAQHELPLGFMSVANHQRAIFGMAMADLDAMLSEFTSANLSPGGIKTALTGQIHNKARLSNVVRELFGEKTGDVKAQTFAAAFANVAEKLRQRSNAAGSAIGKLEKWGLPQWHDPVALIRAGREAWLREITPGLDLARMKHPLTGNQMTPDDLQASLNWIYDDRVSDGWHEREATMAFRGLGSIANQRGDHRFLVFKDADSWMKYADTFGNGSDPLAVMINHIKGMSQDIAAMEVLDPNPRAMLTYMQQFVMKQAALRAAKMPAVFPVHTELSGREFRSHGSMLTSRDPRHYAQSMIERSDNMWDLYRGNSGGSAGNKVAEISQTVRNANVATKLGGAFISALTDPFWQMAARKFAGLPQTKLISDVVRQIAAGGEQEARRAGVVADTYLHMHNQAAREAAALQATKVSGYLAERVITLSGLTTLTRAGNHAMAMGIQGFMADQTAKTFRELDGPIQRLLRRHGLGDADWDAIRLDAGGLPIKGDFLTPSAIREAVMARGGNPQLAERYLAMSLYEAQYATATGTLRAQALTVGNTKAGTGVGEAWRHMAQFKSFAVNMAILHGERMAREFVSQGLWRGAQYGAFALASITLGGALVEQLQQIRNGKDPRDMTDPKFWISAAYRSGGASIWGDLLYASENRFGGGIAQTIAGPTASDIQDLANLTYGAAKKQLIGGQSGDTNYGREIAKTVRNYTPGSSIWYVRQAWNRVLMDNLQRMLDPKAEAAFRRQMQKTKKDYKQDFWWKPGKPVPSRAPDMRAMVPAN